MVLAVLRGGRLRAGGGGRRHGRLGLTVRTGLPAALGWCLLGGLGVPLLATCAALVVERSDRTAHWVRRLTPYLTLLILGLAAQTVLAVAGHPVGWLERAELWSGPVGLGRRRGPGPDARRRAGRLDRRRAPPGLHGRRPGGRPDRAAATVPLARLRERARTAAGVLAALRTVELRSARLAVNSANGSLRQRRLRLPALGGPGRWCPGATPSRCCAPPARLGRAVVLAVPGAALRRPRPRHRGGVSWLATAVALVFGYLAVAQLLEPPGSRPTTCGAPPGRRTPSPG
ncbi:hypothetical protein GCM10020229_55060 [Kitasatospora albolonga]|uniref:hypothetical protein n=1 Tax=Kitasatospora albolonga TaxID=68173 RepID=UPI0031E507B4